MTRCSGAAPSVKRGRSSLAPVGHGADRNYSLIRMCEMDIIRNGYRQEEDGDDE